MAIIQVDLCLPQLWLRTGGFCWCRVLLRACLCLLDYFNDVLFVIELVILIQPDIGCQILINCCTRQLC